MMVILGSAAKGAKKGTRLAVVLVCGMD